MELTFTKAPAVELDVNMESDVIVAGVEIDGQTVGENTIQYLLAYGLKQSLADSYASAKTDAEIEAAFATRLAKIIAGEMCIGSGGGGARLSPVERIARTMAENHALGKGKSSKDAKAWAKENVGAFMDVAQQQHDALADLEIDVEV